MSKKSFRDACRQWESERAKFIKATSLAAYSLTIRYHLEPRFYSLKDVTQESVQRLADEELAAGNNTTTVKGIILVLKMIIRYCERQGWMPERIYDIHFPKRKENPDRYDRYGANGNFFVEIEPVKNLKFTSRARTTA